MLMSGHQLDTYINLQELKACQNFIEMFKFRQKLKKIFILNIKIMTLTLVLIQSL